MTSTTQNSGIDKLREWLTGEYADIMAAEKEALKYLAERNVAAYNKKMREKAEKLAALAEKSGRYLCDLPEATRIKAERAINDFSANARAALDLNSVFYMSALLYNDDHKKGEPDNLKLFIERLGNK